MTITQPHIEVSPESSSSDDPSGAQARMAPPGAPPTANAPAGVPPATDAESDEQSRNAYRTGAIITECSVAGLILITGATQAWDVGHGHSLAMVQTMATFAMLAVVQVAGIAVAIGAWGHSSLKARIVAKCAAVAIALVTVIGVALGIIEQFQARQSAVVYAQEQLAHAEAEKGSLSEKIKEAAADEERWTKAAAAALAAVQGLGQQAGSLPKAICTWSTVQGKDGRVRRQQHCNDDPRTIGALASGATANKTLEDANKKLAQAQTERAKWDPKNVDENVTKAKEELRHATLSSPLHLLAALFFQKPATDLTEAQLYTVLGWFVFIISAAVAFCGQALAMLSVPHRPKSAPAARRETGVAASAAPAEHTDVIFVKHKTTFDRVIDLAEELAKSRANRGPPARASVNDNDKPITSRDSDDEEGGR